MHRTLMALIVLLGCSATAMAAPPTVKISYSPTIDAACALVRGYQIKKEWQEELVQDVGRFNDMWAEIGPKLLSVTEKMTGKMFTQKSIAAHLTLCDLPSQSILGIYVNMRYALSSFTKDPVPMRYKIGVLYHEILHRYVDKLLPAHSNLLDKYQNEPARVREHLHLLALQKAVYLELGMKAELAELIDIDSQLPGGFYKRAWQIVNQGEDDYRKYAEELRNHKP
jgi:hypothetical protein